MAAFSLLIVTHNSARWLAGFAASLGPGRGFFARTVIADAGSNDDTLAESRRSFPSAEILELPNIGFGAAANRAMQRVTSPWVLVCNADLAFGPDFYRSFLSDAEIYSASNPGIACLAPTLVNADGSLQPSVGRFPTIGGIVRDQFRPRWQRKYSWPPPKKPCVVDWATGACLLFRRDAFLQAGGFDEKYFLYAEDVDLQRRLKGAGFCTRYFPLSADAAVTHFAPNALRAPSPEASRYAARGMLRYFAKFGTQRELAIYRRLALWSGRFPRSEAFAPREQILEKSTGP